MARILLAEDDNLLRDNISLLLTSEGHTVKAASDGMEALDFLNSFIPELIVSDIMMPRMNGIELFNQVKKISAIEYVPFIFLTAKVDPSNIREGMNLGADDYLTKPFKSVDLLSTINIRLEKSAQSNHKFERLSKNIAMYVPHELRTPLVSILGYSEIIKEEFESLQKEDIMEMLGSIKYSGQRLLERIEKFILYSELMTNYRQKKFSSDECPCQIFGAEIEIGIRQYLQDELSSRKLIFTMTDAELNIPVRYLQFIVREIVQNSLKFSEKVTGVEVSGSVIDENYVITVLDHGYGFTQEQINSISPFNQFNREKYQQVGNGLGLAIVKRIIEIYNGTLHIISIPGNGTEVRIKFPVNNNE